MNCKKLRTLIRLAENSLALALVVSGIFASNVLAQDRVDIQFPAGSTGTTINGTIVGNEFIDYVLSVDAGQTMYATLSVTGTNGNGSAFFNVLPAGQDFPALYNGSMDDDRSAEVTFEDAGEWAIRVYLMGNDADTGKTVGYSIDVLIPASDAAPGSSAEINTVTNLSAGDLLNVRSGPGTSHGVIGQLGSGDQVRRLRCQGSGDTRWCEIEMMTDMRERGWVNARYLGDGGQTAASGGSSAGQTGGNSTERVAFETGTSGAELTGSLMPGESRRYLLGASNGQDMYVRVAANGPGLSYQIFNPDGTFLLDQITSDREYRGQLWQSGDHVIEVINRGNSTQSYNVIFGVQ